MMSHSGARGSPAQMKQLAAMRGLMAKPSGEIIETPIISNFKEGLDVLEYFNSTHGARKGLADTALKTANSGYLTRRLVDVAQDCDHHARRLRHRRAASRMRAIIDAGQVVASLGVAHPRPHRRPRTSSTPDGAMIVPAGTMIEERAHRRDQGRRHPGGEDPLGAHLRDPRTASAPSATGAISRAARPVNMGEAVGVIAAQSIGEPGTQLTMRTFHIGGAAQIADQSFIESNFEGTVRIRNRNVARNSDGELIAMGRNVAVVIVDPDGTERAVHRLQYGARVKVDEGDTDQARPAHRRVGPLHPPDPHRGRRHGRLRGSRRRRVGDRDGGRVDRHRQARRHRLARLARAPPTCVRRS